MSAFYDLASLVLVPSGYKASKVYAQKPLTADGQLTFSRASTATRVNASGLIETVSSNVPRLDYLGSTCPKILLEPQRSNLYPYSSQLDQWTASGSTVTANYATSPDGTTNADRVQFTAGSVVFMNGTGSAGQNTLSVYAKATNGVSGDFRFFGNGATTLSGNQTATGEWQRFTFTFTFSAVTAGLAAPTSGGGVSDVLFYGFQHEIGAYPTSLIPTTTAAVTRLADACSKTGISSLIGQTEGTLFLDITLGSNPVTLRLFSIASPTWTDNSIRIDWNAIISDSKIVCEGVYGGAQTFQMTSLLPYTKNTRLKIAIGYKSSDCVMYINGVLQQADTTTGTIPACSVVALNELYGFGSGSFELNNFNQTLLFKTRLTNAQLAELTSL